MWQAIHVDHCAQSFPSSPRVSERDTLCAAVNSSLPCLLLACPLQFHLETVQHN